MAFAPALLTASESVNYTRGISDRGLLSFSKRADRGAYFSIAKLSRLTRSALERRGTASPRPTKPETIETMKVWEPCWCGSSTTEQRGSMKVRVANRTNRVRAESPLLAAANRN